MSNNLSANTALPKPLDRCGALYCACLAVRAWHSYQAISKGVARVLLIGYVFQVARTVVKFVSVLVVDDKTMRASAEKSKSNKQVNSPSAQALTTARAEVDPVVPAIVEAWRPDNRPPFGVNTVMLATNASQVGNTVTPFVASHGSPLFGFKFFGGKVLFSQDVNLLDRFTDWLGSLRCANTPRAVCILT